jgi:hypothetical protein
MSRATNAPIGGATCYHAVALAAQAYSNDIRAFRRSGAAATAISRLRRTHRFAAQPANLRSRLQRSYDSMGFS